jgi:hypothetical protein
VLAEGCLISRWYDPCRLDHENDRPLWSPGPVQSPFGHHHSLAGTELDQAILQVDPEPTLDYVEELVVRVMLVPVVLPLHHPKPHYRIIHPAESLVIPSIGAGSRESGHIHTLERAELVGNLLAPRKARRDRGLPTEGAALVA